MSFIYKNTTDEAVNIGGILFKAGGELRSNIDFTTTQNGLCFTEAIKKGILSVNGKSGASAEIVQTAEEKKPEVPVEDKKQPSRGVKNSTLPAKKSDSEVVPEFENKTGNEQTEENAPQAINENIMKTEED